MERSFIPRLRWLNKPPLTGAGVTWGIPWPEGLLQRNESLKLINSGGHEVPVQSWATAFWPDGSVKWTGHAAAFAAQDGLDGGFTVDKGDSEVSPYRVSVTETDTQITIDTGSIVLELDKTGETVIRAVHRGTQKVCSDGRLICLREETSELSGTRVVKEERYFSRVHKFVVEQNGPLRAVVRMEGKHQCAAAGRSWIPFIIRLYCFASQESFRIVHTFLYDGNPHRDFIKGIGLVFSVPMEGALYNRHIRFVGDSGCFSESPKNLMTIRTQGKYQELYRKQFSGESVMFNPEEDAHFLGLLDESAVWESFKLVQDSCDHYSIWKQTKKECCFIKACDGQRTQGLMYCGSELGGLAFSVRNFWEKYPSALEAHDLAKENAQCVVWFWSPDCRAMDLRHYDTETHLQSSYEGFEEMRSTPYGIGNTNELTIWCAAKTPRLSELQAMAEEGRSPAVLCCEPEYYHDVRAFGVWGLPTRSTPSHSFLEDQLDGLLNLYKEEIEQRRWYGFWDYGDVMHSYDPVRHTWRYDIGGCAWQNTELVPNMWLWYMFLRTGREDVFRLAEAMTRHTSETDVYHFGEYRGLGSRHNVVHWGCGCKEARISMAGLHRFYYYLTADERIGDIMDEVKDSDYTTENLDPMRAYFPKDEFPTHTRVGPDWTAFVSNWMTRWERYEDQVYHKKLMNGIDSFKRMPDRMKSLATHGYNPKTGEVFYMGKDSGHHLAICMGEPQVWMELSLILKDSEWDEMLIEIGEFYNLSKEEKSRRTNGRIPGTGYGLPMASAGITAYAAVRKHNRHLADRAWGLLLSNEMFGAAPLMSKSEPVMIEEFIRPLSEIPDIATNTVSQWALNVMVCLDLIGDCLPEIERKNPRQTDAR